MRSLFFPLGFATLFTLISCQQTRDNATTGTGTVDASTDQGQTPMDDGSAATGNATAAADEANATPNTRTSPDTLTPAVGAAVAGQTAADADFMVKAAEGGMMEVEASRLAQAKSQNATVKALADQMIADHTKANDQLKAIAARKEVKLPPALMGEKKTAYDRLTKLSGRDFDAAYQDQMLKDHQQSVALFEKEANSGKDADAKAFATSTLPTLRKHLEMVQKQQSMH